MNTTTTQPGILRRLLARLSGQPKLPRHVWRTDQEVCIGTIVQPHKHDPSFTRTSYRIATYQTCLVTGETRVLERVSLTTPATCN